jgi:hypothetical protein
MLSTICYGVITWWEYFEPGEATLIMEHDYGEMPDDEYIIDCLGEHYERATE